MTILYDAKSPVKPARRFGIGILPTYPVHHLDVTEADRRWWAAESNGRGIDAEADAMAAESESLARHEAGYCC